MGGGAAVAARREEGHVPGTYRTVGAVLPPRGTTKALVKSGYPFPYNQTYSYFTIVVTPAGQQRRVALAAVISPVCAPSAVVGTRRAPPSRLVRVGVLPYCFVGDRTPSSCLIGAGFSLCNLGTGGLGSGR